MEQPTEIGDWKQISVLGSGAFGTVMLWKNQTTSDFVAIKKCKFQNPSALSAKQKQRWTMEVDFLKAVSHPNVIGFKPLDPLLEQMINKNNPTKLALLSMEYCKKGNLRRYLSNEPIKLCGLPEQDVRFILEDVLNGLEYLHSKGITHRDIKPDNIVLQHCDNRKGATIYKIIDLGYAKELQDSTLSFVGTLHYLAPEIFFSQNYNQRVDYWSMGTMAFEIICGVLPFLPDLTPFERFEKIKTKGPGDICIYTSNSGAITSSTELKKEHFITSCFKYNIENWLKRVLQMDPANRVFNDDIGALEYLRFILDIKIIKVFSVYKQEFYSYEISTSTLLGTLKAWISRDIKIPKTDLLYLFHSQEKDKIWFCNDDNTLLEYLVSNDDVIVYVYKKDALLSEKPPAVKMPSLVKDLFNIHSTHQIKSARNVYRQAVFYVYSEYYTVAELKNAYLCLIQHLKDSCEKIGNKYATARSDFNELLSKVEHFLEKKKNGKSSANNNVDENAYAELGECLKKSEIIISDVEQRWSKLKDFGKQTRLAQSKKPEFDRVITELEETFGKYDIKSQFDNINGKMFLEKPKNGEYQNAVLKRIKDVVSDTLKLKCNLFMKKESLKNCSKDLCTILKWTEQLLNWIDGFTNDTQKLSNEFSAIEAKHDEIIMKRVIKKKEERVITYDLADTQKLIEENELLRCRVADVLLQNIAEYKSFVDDYGTNFNLN